MIGMMVLIIKTRLLGIHRDRILIYPATESFVVAHGPMGAMPSAHRIDLKITLIAPIITLVSVAPRARPRNKKFILA